MVYNDGTDDEPLDVRVFTPDGRVIYSNCFNNIRFKRVESVWSPIERNKEDDLSKYYDYICDQSDQLDVGEKEKDTNTLYYRIAFSSLAASAVSGSIGIGIKSYVLLFIAIAAFAVMIIFANLCNGKDSFYE